MIVHISQTANSDSIVIRPLRMIRIRASVFIGDGGTIEDRVSRVVVKNRTGAPFPLFLCPINVRSIPGVPRQACSQLEEAKVRDGIFVIVARVEGVDLPPKTATTRG